MFNKLIFMLIIGGSLLLLNQTTYAQPENNRHAYFLPVVVTWNHTFYVSKSGNNSSGNSWATAWNELDQINWSVIEPGDLIVIDGGAQSMTYSTTLEIGQSGTAEEPITIRLSKQPGHDGKAIFFGGRARPLPYCYQKDYIYEPGNFRNGVFTNDHSWIILDGTKWGGFTIYGYSRNGVSISRQSSNILIRHIEVYDNGFAEELDNGRGWVPDEPGVRLAGENITFERVLIHDNGQDAIQSLFGENNIHNFVVRQSWLYNGRKHPTVNESSNYCRHSDGLQIYDGGLIEGVTFEESIIGPGFTQAMILGQTLTEGGSKTDVHNVTVRHTLIIKSADNGLVGYRLSNSHNWVIDHVTFHCPNTKGHCLRIDNASHEVTNSIFYDAIVTFPDGLNSYSGNCRWLSSGFDIGVVADPKFTVIVQMKMDTAFI